MTNLYIEEYAELARDSQDNLMGIPGNLVTNQKVTVGASSAQSSAFDGRTKFIMIISDVPCQYEHAKGETNPTADSSSRYLPTDAFRYIPVDGLDKIAVIEQQ